jgi:tRNA-modifying protein YgfZ
MHKLPLAELHLSLGALFGEAETKELPISYGDPFAEHQEARTAWVVYDRSYRTLLHLAGEDRATWLHGMTTSEVKKLSENRSQSTTFCTAKGKMLGQGTITKRQNDIIIDADPSGKDNLLASLDRLLITEEVTISDQSGQSNLFTVVGPNASASLAYVVSDAPVMEDGEYREFPWLGGVLGIRRGTLFGLPSFDYFPRPESAQDLLRSLAQKGRLLGHQAAEWLRIEAGEVRYGQDATDATIPQEAGLDAAISYTKGCYLGQETIARLHYRGHVNRHLRGFVLAEGAKVPSPGALVRVGAEEKGKVTSACLSPALGRVIAMGYIRREYAESGQALAIEVEGGLAPGEVRELPFLSLSQG